MGEDLWSTENRQIIDTLFHLTGKLQGREIYAY
jgi:hypothetical protein